MVAHVIICLCCCQPLGEKGTGVQPAVFIILLGEDGSHVYVREIHLHHELTLHVSLGAVESHVLRSWNACLACSNQQNGVSVDIKLVKGATTLLLS